ncbi:hypothetical protein GALL_532570 [mine drainage metagenome]|uniref:Uncharacterized protein n=1 Tax=mine drainage metagenome TaxID=410659 RepID=A0A1J5P296_9ZZZZ
MTLCFSFFVVMNLSGRWHRFVVVIIVVLMRC